jgi:lactate dehydrogenase-like 2-hydroxyacid dehydrogenase
MSTSDRPRVAVTRRLPVPCEDRLNSGFDVIWGDDDRAYDRDSLLDLVGDADALIASPAEKLEADAIAALPDSVKVISLFSVGYDYVALDAAKARGIIVTNTPGVLTEATADIAFLLLLGAARHAGAGERMVRQDEWPGWRPTQLIGTDLAGKTLGIFGMGRIGAAVARRAVGFGLKVIYHNRRPTDAAGMDAAYVADLDEFLTRSEFLSLHAPLTKETEGFLNAERIARLPERAIVVNTARGQIVDDDALISALKSGRIGAAGLDVFTNEPDLDIRYRDLDNVFLLPHLGSATEETREAMGMLAIDNLEAVLAGRPPLHRVV